MPLSLEPPCQTCGHKRSLADAKAGRVVPLSTVISSLADLAALREAARLTPEIVLARYCIVLSRAGQQMLKDASDHAFDVGYEAGREAVWREIHDALCKAADIRQKAKP